jgi:RNA polymerase sigma-70 factor (ECF subfamily)
MEEQPQRAEDSASELAELIARARAKDDAALEQLIRAYQRRVAATVISLIGREDDWQDVCQQIFVKMVLGLRRLDKVDAFEPWLMRIARNAAFDHLRRRRTLRFLTPWQSWHESIPSEPAPPEESRSAALDSAIERLPADQRELMTLVRSKHWSYEGLMRATGLSLGAVKSRLFRARRRLRELMTEGESGSEN